MRAELHADVADWLEPRPGAADEIVGYHLEQACLLAAELGRAGERERALAGARGRAPRAPRRSAALARGDPAAASALLERAIALVASDEDARGALLPALGRVAVRSRPDDRGDARARRGDRRARPTPRAARRARGSSARSCGWRPRPASATEHVARGRRRGPAGARARGRRRAASAARGRCARRSPGSPGGSRDADDGVARGRRVRPAGGRRARALRRPRLARDRGRARPDAGRRGDRAAARGFATIVAASPVARRLDDQPARRRCTRCSGELRARRALPRARPTRRCDELGSLRLERLASRGARAAARRAARARRGRRCARTSRRLAVDERAGAAGDDDRDARAGRLRPGTLRRGRRAVRDDRRAGGRRRHRHAGHLARRARRRSSPARALRARPRRSRARRSRSSSRPTCSSHHGDAMLDLAEVLRAAARRGESRDARCAPALALYERKGNVAAMRAARALARLERRLTPRRDVRVRVSARIVWPTLDRVTSGRDATIESEARHGIRPELRKTVARRRDAARQFTATPPPIDEAADRTSRRPRAGRRRDRRGRSGADPTLGRRCRTAGQGFRGRSSAMRRSRSSTTAVRAGRPSRRRTSTLTWSPTVTIDAAVASRPSHGADRAMSR